MIYRVLDENTKVYQVVPHKDVRSRMNICFRLGDDAKEREFLDGAKARNFLGLAGHRSVKGVRISNYNSVSMESIQRLVDYLLDFALRQQ